MSSVEPTDALADALDAAQLTGVELRFANSETIAPLIGSLLDQQIDLISIASTIQMPRVISADSAWLDPVRRAVMTAAENGCPQVRLMLKRSAYRPAIARLADQLGAIAELGGDANVRVLIDAEEQFAEPSDLWRLLELAQSNNLAASLSLPIEHRLTTGAADENACQTTAVHRSPTDDRQDRRRAKLSIPLLNSRIRQVTIQCPVAPIATPPRWLGDALHHLLGIGYDGWLMIETERAGLQACATILRPLAQVAAPNSK